MGFGRRIGDTFRVPGRGFRRALAVLVVLLMAAATGSAVALSAPSLVSDLGLSSQRQADAQLPAPVPVLGPLATAAPLPTSMGLSGVLDPLARSSALGEFAGVVVDPASADTLWQRSPERSLVPGSTSKLLTAAAALLSLNPTERLYTKVVAGPTPDTVILVGGGDPTLTALPEGQDSVYPVPSRLDELVTEVRKAVPGRIRTVLVDTSRYTGPTLAQGWQPADVPGGYVAPIVPLMLDGGREDPSLQDGPRVTQPALTAGRALAEELGASTVDEGVAVPGATVLGSVASAPISDLVEHLMRTSDNVLAEALAREVAIVRGGDPSFTGAAAQVLAALSQAGFDPSGAVMVDGSGLSTADRVPARLLGALLATAAAPAQGARDTQFLRPILTGLPVAGGDGTLDSRFGTSNSDDGRGVVRAKTGTLTGVSSLAGVVTNADGRLLVFALISNGESPATVRPRLDTIAAALSRCGCR
ncbi:D-alanyl-D-alanine carboxypeptidase/D-alanyl-D-alanine-endopeptidase [Pseudonocardia sp. H11422]|uniref:D-alanyl-D-alanine carboxypeptidase/D-alanyl-D-alanine endopeptidase n=1 Tax=Pseudonocardia sp. H11422 TaxID=2835866 RepID=UPI001BDCB499|nr:D-alanyl-D-alanine carboxypeptidase/D-alanyl-D-alanine-endopeptidase [Pseudonocardia sp. H11422]